MQMSECGVSITNHFTQICGTKRDCMVRDKSTIPTLQFRLATSNLCFSETFQWDRKVTRDVYKKVTQLKILSTEEERWRGISKSSCDRLKGIEISSSPLNCQEEWHYAWCVERWNTCLRKRISLFSLLFVSITDTKRATYNHTNSYLILVPTISNWGTPPYFPASVTSISIITPLGMPGQVPSSEEDSELLLIGSLNKTKQNKTK